MTLGQDLIATRLALRGSAPGARPASRDDGVGASGVGFDALLGAAGWQRLSPAIRKRFGRRLRASASVTYAGEIVESRRTGFGHLLAQLGRLFGAPLALDDDIGVPAVVTVIEDAATGGQIWSRIYGRTRGFPQIIQSRKRFAGPTGLEEHLGCGFGMALTVTAERDALHFHSDHYFVALGAVRLRWPRWLEPGALTVSHIDRGDRGFAFVLTLHHPLFGEILSQTSLFREGVLRECKENPHD